jgi:hypothetical protein
MIRVAITEAAYDAICATLPLGSLAVEPEASERGERTWRRSGSTGSAMRGPGEDYSDAILRIATMVRP